MRKVKLALVTGVLMAFTVLPLAPVPTPHACDPSSNNPCDIQPQEVPHFCKLSPTC